MRGSEMARYHFRLFFDAGSGACLWSQNEAAKARFYYHVDAATLGLPQDMVDEIEALITDYDAAFDWADPGGPQEALVAFGYEPDAPLRQRVRDLLPRLRAALGPDFEIESDFEAAPHEG